ncbi:Eukaryotic translation initiation factor 3 subunit M [Pestalotiopsis fici W106-1]|uniref:Eukaryotic translation initiation factor 3 subunit M n=1 Tax=Pestalotiopsis fici (strain W106-1 / CGMCC3.15140) TaxID=1229662 RepID=W3XQE7_PESFW|nr:Eukaryotic translation initiation factor 3 subunit M [Pestalotiopsis fici W106-1]ETS87722.1 Eukaryotic translation initiation factor 3 subunit M [Pestalotiopsis fici W106-1]
MDANFQPQLVFVDGSFNELAQEMADYVNVGAEVKPLIEKDQQDEVLKKIIIASTALNSVPEREFSAAYNLLVYLVLQSKNPNMFLSRVCDNLSKPITTSPQNGPGLALGALTNIFNMTKPDDQTRYHVFLAIVKFTINNGTFEQLKKYLPKLESWVQQWDIDEEDERKLYELISQAASQAGDDKTSYEYILKAVRTFDDEDNKTEEAQKLTLRAVKSALLSSTHFDFSDLLAISAVSALQESQPTWYDLLMIFAEKDLEDYKQFDEEHAGFLEKENLDADKLNRKMRLLTFASLAAAESKSREIPYAKISEALSIPEEDIELWTIDVIRAGLVEGKLSQRQKVFLVHRAWYRVFGEKQWRELSDRVDGWASTLKDVAQALRREQANVEAARKREQEEIERKLAGTGLEDNKPQRGGRRGNAGDNRPPPKPRTDDDD